MKRFEYTARVYLGIRADELDRRLNSMRNEGWKPCATVKTSPDTVRYIFKREIQ